LTISIAPDLHLALTGYAAIHQQAYSDEQVIIDLVPHMLAAFLASDRGFVETRERDQRWKRRVALPSHSF